MTTKTRNIIIAFTILIVASAIPALIFGKWLEAAIFVICHTLIRPQFDKQYHHVIPEICWIITGSVMFFGVCLTLPLKYSLLSAIPINYFIGWVGFLKKDNDDKEIDIERLTNKNNKIAEKLKEFEKIDIYKMNEDDLRAFAGSKGLSETQQDILVLRILHNYRIVDICNERNYGRTTIKYHISEIKKKLNIKNI